MLARRARLEGGGSDSRQIPFSFAWARLASVDVFFWTSMLLLGEKSEALREMAVAECRHDGDQAGRCCSRWPALCACVYAEQSTKVGPRSTVQRV